MPDANDIREWHRRFASECNNLGYDLAEKSDRTDAENREMLSAAYAAAFHWSRVGEPINHARADILLARVHALLGNGGEALRFARRALEFCETGMCEDWDLAFAHGTMALAARAAGEASLHGKHYDEAVKAGKRIKDDEDREVFMNDFSRVPKPAHSGSAA